MVETFGKARHSTSAGKGYAGGKLRYWEMAVLAVVYGITDSNQRILVTPLLGQHFTSR